MYVYIYTEREIEREISFSVYTCTQIYKYMYGI